MSSLLSLVVVLPEGHDALTAELRDMYASGQLMLVRKKGQPIPMRVLTAVADKNTLMVEAELTLPVAKSAGRVGKTDRRKA